MSLAKKNLPYLGRCSNMRNDGSYLQMHRQAECTREITNIKNDKRKPVSTTVGT